MPDVFTKARRSEVMSLIRSHGNKATELRLAAIFRAQGLTGWRRQMVVNARVATVNRSKVERVKVRPDFVFRRERLAVFVDGCFWHGCPEHGTRPKGNRKFWDMKIARNQERDRRVTRILRKSGWRVLRVWEHELTVRRGPQLLRRLRRWILRQSAENGA